MTTSTALFAVLSNTCPTKLLNQCIVRNLKLPVK